MDGKIVIIGCGPGAKDLMTLRGRTAIDEADIVIGSKRLLSDFVKKNVKTMTLENNYRKALEDADMLKEGAKIVFLVSGDPLFYSFGESVIKRFGKENCELIPGISSVQYAFCKIKESWKDYKVFSLHGIRNADINKIFEENERFILLLDSENNLKSIKEKAGQSERKYSFYVASNLSGPAENISKVTIDQFDGLTEQSLSILIVRRENG